MGILSALVHETLNFSEASSLFKTHSKFPNYALWFSLVLVQNLNPLFEIINLSNTQS